jgi:hypothetical protein
VISTWGNMRAYSVHDIDFNTSPAKMTFYHDKKETSVLEYFRNVYGKDL